MESLVRDRKGREHETYLALWNLLQREDKVIAALFDGMRRSVACQQLAGWVAHGLVSEEELAGFSEETQARVRWPAENIWGWQEG